MAIFPVPENLKPLVGYVQQLLQEGYSLPESQRFLQSHYLYRYFGAEEVREVMRQAERNWRATQTLFRRPDASSLGALFRPRANASIIVGVRVYFVGVNPNGTRAQGSITVNAYAGSDPEKLLARAEAFLKSGFLARRGRGTEPVKFEDVHIYQVVEGGFQTATLDVTQR